MSRGMSGISDKQKRATRRKNHIKKDLMSVKYRQRVKQPEKEHDKKWKLSDDDLEIERESPVPD